MDSGGTCMHASSCFIETINNLPIILHLRWHRVHTLRSLIARWITFARTPTSFFVTTDYILLTAVRTAALVSYVVHDIAYYFLCIGYTRILSSAFVLRYTSSEMRCEEWVIGTVRC